MNILSDEVGKSQNRSRIKDAVARIAPSLAHALGGPLAGAAVEQLSRAVFGAGTKSEDALADALERAGPEHLVAIKKAEQEFQIALRQARVEETRIDANDRANARERQVEMKDWTPSILGALVIVGFFAVLGFMVVNKLPPGAETEFSIMLGALATMTAAVVNYFFGSSAGSREKTRLIAWPLPEEAMLRPNSRRKADDK